MHTLHASCEVHTLIKRKREKRSFFLNALYNVCNFQRTKTINHTHNFFPFAFFQAKVGLFVAVASYRRYDVLLCYCRCCFFFHSLHQLSNFHSILSQIICSCANKINQTTKNNHHHIKSLTCEEQKQHRKIAVKIAKINILALNKKEIIQLLVLIVL